MSNCNHKNSCSIATVNEYVIQMPRLMPKISVNGVILDKDLIAKEMQYHPAKSFNEAKYLASQALVIRQVLLEKVQTAIADGLDEETAIARLIEENIPKIEIDETECQRFYQQNKHLFQSPPLMIVRHILLAAAKDDLVGRAEQKQLADKLIADLHSTDNLRQAFAEQIHLSRCPSKNNGGLLGEISAGQTVAEFERQLFMLAEGLAAAPIETRYGYHIVYVEKKKEGQAIDFAVCLDKIRQYLTERRYRQAISEYLHEQIAQAQISGIKLKIAQENIFME